MHEQSIASAIIRTVLSFAASNSISEVKEVRVKIGVLKAVLPDLLVFAFDAMKKSHKVLCNATLVIDEVPLTIKCNDCGAESSVERAQAVCPVCGSANVNLVGGNEFFVEELKALVNG